MVKLRSCRKSDLPNISCSCCCPQSWMNSISSLTNLKSVLALTERIVCQGIASIRGQQLGTSATLLCLHVLSQISEIKMRNILNLVMLLKLAILIQISSVPCERGFLLKIEFILSRLRTSMSNKTLNDRMMNSENGPHINSLGKLPKSGNG